MMLLVAESTHANQLKTFPHRHAYRPTPCRQFLIVIVFPDNHRLCQGIQADHRACCVTLGMLLSLSELQVRKRRKHNQFKDCLD